MKVSDEDLAAIQTVVERDAYSGEDEMLARLFRELMALRKVAEAANDLYTSGGVSWSRKTRLFDVLKEAGYGE